MKSKYTQFRKLHQQATPLLLGNIWDVTSAQVLEAQGFQALGTSSSAIAHTLGYEDGEDMPFDDLLFMVRKIVDKTNLPVTVDMEGGYSRDTATIIKNIEKLRQLGVTGINIEDSIVKGKREILPADEFGETVKAIKDHLRKNNTDIFVNVRTDTYLLGLPNAAEETKKREKVYEEAGADGLFIPCIVKTEDIKTATASTTLPVNVMCMPDLPPFEALTRLGVKRISMGDFVHSYTTNKLKEMIGLIRECGSFKPLF